MKELAQSCIGLRNAMSGFDCRECGLLTPEPHQFQYLQPWPLPESGQVGCPGCLVTGLRDPTFPKDGVEDAACVNGAAS